MTRDARHEKLIAALIRQAAADAKSQKPRCGPGEKPHEIRAGACQWLDDTLPNWRQRQIPKKGYHSMALPHVVGAHLSGCPGARTIARTSTNPARPYICRLMVFKRLMGPSPCPRLQGRANAAATSP
jgi:hypothetical protein